MREYVIFDLDGTLVETEQVWRDVRKAFALEHGGCWHENAQATMIGMRTDEWARYMHEDLGVGMDVKEIARRVIDEVVQRLRTVPIVPGAAEALERFSHAFRLGLATSAARPIAEAVLATTGWSDYFDAVVSADDVERGKPEPDVYLRAVEQLKADPQRTAAIEDSTNGLRSAHAAGLAVIAIPNREFAPHETALSLASRVIDKLDDLDVELVKEVIAAAALRSERQ